MSPHVATAKMANCRAATRKCRQAAFRCRLAHLVARDGVTQLSPERNRVLRVVVAISRECLSILAGVLRPCSRSSDSFRIRDWLASLASDATPASTDAAGPQYFAQVAGALQETPPPRPWRPAERGSSTPTSERCRSRARRHTRSCTTRRARTPPSRRRQSRFPTATSIPCDRAQVWNDRRDVQDVPIAIDNPVTATGECLCISERDPSV